MPPVRLAPRAEHHRLFRAVVAKRVDPIGLPLAARLPPGVPSGIPNGDLLRAYREIIDVEAVGKQLTARPNRPSGLAREAHQFEVHRERFLTRTGAEPREEELGRASPGRWHLPDQGGRGALDHMGDRVPPRAWGRERGAAPLAPPARR